LASDAYRFIQPTTSLPQSAHASRAPSKLSQYPTDAGAVKVVNEAMATLSTLDIGALASARSQSVMDDECVSEAGQLANDAALQAIEKLKHLDAPEPIVASPFKMPKSSGSSTPEEGLLSQARDLAKARHMVNEALNETQADMLKTPSAVEPPMGAQQSMLASIAPSAGIQQAPVDKEPWAAMATAVDRVPALPPRPPSRPSSDNGLPTNRSSRSGSQGLAAVDEAMQAVLQRISSREQGSKPHAIGNKQQSFEETSRYTDGAVAPRHAQAQGSKATVATDVICSVVSSQENVQLPVAEAMLALEQGINTRPLVADYSGSTEVMSASASATSSLRVADTVSRQAMRDLAEARLAEALASSQRSSAWSSVVEEPATPQASEIEWTAAAAGASETVLRLKQALFSQVQSS